jgi:hypothetical protein
MRASSYLVLFVVVSMAVGCMRQSRDLAGAPPSELVVVADDSRFDAPHTIAAGPTPITLRNKGREVHQVQLVRLAEGKKQLDFIQSLQGNPTQLPRWAEPVGGPNAVVSNEEASAMVELQPGDYLLICQIPNKQGVPHAVLGMQKPLHVTAGTSARQPTTAAHHRIEEVDFTFLLPQPLRPGRQTIHVVNRGSQTHEVAVIQLAPGASIGAFAAAMAPGEEGPPPGKPVGGMTGLARGRDGLFTVDLAPGRYGLICFLPDSLDGAPHFAKGMAMEFTIEP